jgi:hypothetical protein
MLGGGMGRDFHRWRGVVCRRRSKQPFDSTLHPTVGHDDHRPSGSSYEWRQRTRKHELVGHQAGGRCQVNTITKLTLSAV